MSRKIDDLLLKRGRLIERIAGQRTALRQDLVPVAQSLEAVDRGVAGIQAGLAYVHRHALAFSAAAGALLLFRGNQHYAGRHAPFRYGSPGAWCRWLCPA